MEASQVLNATIQVPVPDGYTIVKTSELEELEKSNLKGNWLILKDIEKMTKRKKEWIKANILEKKRFRQVLDVRNGGFVHYPDNSGDPYLFQATRMTNFLEENFAEIMKDGE